MPKLNLTYQSAMLLRHVLTTTGEKEVSPDGKEQLASLRLNGEEASQRRHYFKNSAEVLEPIEKKYKEDFDKVNAKIKEITDKIKEDNKKEEKEEDKVYDQRITRLINNDKEVKKLLEEAKELANATNNTKVDIELTTKTLDVVKKYFAEFGDKNGWTSGDDEAVSEIEEALK